MLGAQGLHQLDVHGLIAVGGEDTQVSLAPDEKETHKLDKPSELQSGRRNHQRHLRKKLGNKWQSSSETSVEGAKLSSRVQTERVSRLRPGSLLIQSLGGLPDSTGESVVDECGLQHFGQGGVHIHHTSGSDAVHKRDRRSLRGRDKARVYSHDVQRHAQTTRLTHD